HRPDGLVARPLSTVRTVSWLPGGVPAQPSPSIGTNTAAVSCGGYTRRPRTGVGRQTASSKLRTWVNATTVLATAPGASEIAGPLVPARNAAGPTWWPSSPAT